MPQDSESDNRYTRARDLLRQWRSEGILRPTQRPSFWVLEQEFDLPEIGRRKVKGFIGLVRLQDYGSGRVLPHEKVLNRPLADRLRLTEATGTQFEYIWSLYQDQAYVIDNLLDQAEYGDPIVDCPEEEARVRHRLWRLTDAKACGTIRRTMERLPIYIADGHHRYQAMLTHRDRMRALHPEAGPEAPWEFIMMFLVNSRHEGLTVLPTHRLLHDLDLKRRGLSDLHLGILEHFHVKSYLLQRRRRARRPPPLAAWPARRGGGRAQVRSADRRHEPLFPDHPEGRGGLRGDGGDRGELRLENAGREHPEHPDPEPHLSASPRRSWPRRSTWSTPRTWSRRWRRSVPAACRSPWS